MSRQFPGVTPLAQQGRRAPAPPPLVSRTPQLLWRPQTFRVSVASAITVPLYDSRSLAVGLEIYADGDNTVRILVGSRLLTSSATSPDGVPGNNYFQLDPGRHAYIWTDQPETETFDVAMYFATQYDVLAPAADQYLHCTQWQAQAIAGPR